MHRSDADEAAFARYQSAIHGAYAPLLAGRKTRDEALAFAQARGAKLVRDDDVSISLVDEAASLSLTIQWDPDHECWYCAAEFLPNASAPRDPAP
ncbi:MAG: hypothetical protein U0269_18700 [Polyangiales bacterium]